MSVVLSKWIEKSMGFKLIQEELQITIFVMLLE